MAEDEARERDDAPEGDSTAQTTADTEPAGSGDPGAADGGEADTPASHEEERAAAPQAPDDGSDVSEDRGEDDGAGEDEAGEPDALDAATTRAPSTGATPAAGTEDGAREGGADTEAPTAAVAPVAASGAASGTTGPTGSPAVRVPSTEAPTTQVPPVASSSVDAPTVQVPPTPAAGTPAPAGAEGAEPSSRRRPLIAVLVAAAAVVVVGLVVWLVSGTGTSGTSGTTAAGPGVPPEQAAASVTVTLSPAASASAVAPSAPAEVHVADGRLGDIALTGPKGAVAGVATPDGWRSTGPLAYGATYTWSGSAVDSEGRSAPVTGSFTTVDPQQKIAANLNIADDATVGVGAPIIVQFSGDVTDKAAAERALTVRTSVPTEGSWAWLPDTEQGSRAHWRPKEYWKPGTQVDVAANLFGVNTGGGAWGAQDVTSHFTIGRSQIVKADVNSFQMVVVRDGQTVMTLPASYGLGSDPNRNTTNGVHVVMSKEADKLMTNPAYGYFNVPEKWAVRISNNGEFIHANPKSTSAQGNDNVTHGCVNLSTADAQAYFDTAMFGDPVEVTGSPVPMPRTDIYDWSLTWSEWQSMSALKS